jgi:RHH-type transcriptional regulator, rel operon repressor / antitoxin RelB
MAETRLISVRVPTAVAAKLEALASSTDRSKSYLAAQAIEEYITTQEWQIATIKEGIKSADAGEFVDHAKVVDWLNSWGTEHEKELP